MYQFNRLFKYTILFGAYDKSIEKPLSNKAIYDLFFEIYNNSKEVGNYKSYELEDLYYYDFLKFDEKETFIKIGKVNENSSIEKRNKDILESSPIEVDENEQLDKITYYYMDFETGIVSILSADGIGYGTAIKNLILTKYKKSKLNVDFANILTKDVIKMIMEKDIIGTIEYSYAVPNDDILSDDININPVFFSDIENKKAMVLSCVIPIKRNKSAFKNNDLFKNLIDKLYKTHGTLKSLLVNAKNKDESMHTFNLLKYRFTAKIECEIKNFSNYEFIYALIRKEYINRKNEICKLVNIKNH